jgi:hypothetical protein
MTAPRCLATLSLAVLAAACGPETTTFRTVDKGDATQRPGPPSAAYDVELAALPAAHVHLWSNGGYVSSAGDPSTHIGFEIHNLGTRPLVFDSDALELVVVDNSATAFPARFTALTPAGSPQIQIAPGDTMIIASYFVIPIRPRAVDSMRLRWTLRSGDQTHEQVTSFVRDDGHPVVDHPRTADAALPTS